MRERASSSFKLIIFLPLGQIFFWGFRRRSAFRSVSFRPPPSGYPWLRLSPTFLRSVSLRFGTRLRRATTIPKLCLGILSLFDLRLKSHHKKIPFAISARKQAVFLSRSTFPRGFSLRDFPASSKSSHNLDISERKS